MSRYAKRNPPPESSSEMKRTKEILYQDQVRRIRTLFFDQLCDPKLIAVREQVPEEEVRRIIRYETAGHIE